MSAVVTAARAWIGTPYQHQCSTKGAGCDCLGLLRGVWRDVVGPEPEPLPPYTPSWDEIAKRDVLQEAAARWMSPTPDMMPGTVLLFRMRGGAVAKHLGICTDAGSHPRFVHAYSGHGVVETSLSASWSRRLAGLYAIPGHT